MGGVGRMSEVVKNFWVLQSIEAFGFCRFIFQKHGYDLEKGIVLVTEDNLQAQQVADAILDTIDSKKILRYTSRTELPLNYEIGLHLYRKYDKEEELIEFLFTKDFLPLIIVGGLVPEFLAENAYIFRIKLMGKDIRDFKLMYEKMKTKVKSQINHLSYEIQNVKTSRALMNSQNMSSCQRFSEIIVLTGKVWQMVIRESNDEDTSEAWLQEYCLAAETALESMADLCEMCDVSEVVRRCVVSYVSKNDVKIQDFHANKGADYETIWYDDDFYYFTEPLLKKICQSLLDVVSFTQIKAELHEGGILVCNTMQKRNFTVKKICFNSQTGKMMRTRFLRLLKKELLTDEGMELEELVEIKQENAEMEEFEYGNDNRLCAEEC